MGSQLRKLEDHIVVGCPAILHTQPRIKDGPRLKAVIRGWLAGSYVLLDVSDEDDASLTRHQACVVRFIHEGKACGFPAEVLECGKRANTHCQVSWPESVEVVTFRKHERIAIGLKCTVSDGDNPSTEGQVRDLSTGGCGVLLPTAREEDTTLQLSFQLPDGAIIDGLPCVVRRVRAIGEGVLHGCEFQQAAAEVVQEIEFYISTTLERLRLEERTEPRVLFIEENGSRIQVLRQELGQRGYDVAVASGIMDGFFRMRVVRPDLLLVNETQKGLNGADLCRIVRETHGFEALPIFLYGEGESTGEDKTAKSGATGYFPTISMTEEVMRQIDELGLGAQDTDDVDDADDAENAAEVTEPPAKEVPEDASEAPPRKSSDESPPEESE